ncbi:hypothetical protein ACO0RG_001652 [Hanseniaspora osmophila]|uniref:Mitochondrial inner membrane i-AAA protease complex subunit MGR1 n=1 Tax=Hanseniaspora osmophila TaxID=56408 RepID=A0A1E5RI35_9ASCO|nr:Mitochondrial inner membrane i-AAA protease complex subunit MGR1 [Hanseniaspora osmophila]
MGLYSPPDKNPGSSKLREGNSSNGNSDGNSSGSNDNNNNNNNNRDNNSSAQNPMLFTSRPSVGLRLWGPLVPASDCTWGMWTLLGIQTAIGFTLLTKFRVSLWKYRMGKTVTKEIADIPSLNRFSTTHGTIQYKPENLLKQVNGTAPVAKNGLNQFGGTHTFHFIHQPTRWEKLVGKWKNSMYSRWMSHSMRLVYLFSGSILLSLSMLEFSRLVVFDYDPWVEQMKSAREKQFYNDTSRFYREGVDPSKFEVKVQDAATGKFVDVTSDPEIRAHVAMARALMVQNSWISKWFGPLEVKPLTFKEYLDKIEQYEVSKLAAEEAFKLIDARLAMPLPEAVQHLNTFALDSENTRKKTLELLHSLPANVLPSVSSIYANNPLNDQPDGKGAERKTLGQAPKEKHNSLQLQDDIKIFPPNCKEPQQVRVGDTWLYNDPWSKLGVETHLGVKIIPSTPTYFEETNDGTNTTNQDSTLESSGNFTINNSKDD